MSETIPEKVTIKNFLSIEYIELDLSQRINVVIGPQAHGKSILAKVVFLFKNFINDYETSILKAETKRDFDRNFIAKFKLIFPSYSWEKSYFHLKYEIGDQWIQVSHPSNSSSQSKLDLDYSEPFKKERSNLKKKYKKLYSQSQPLIRNSILDVKKNIRETLLRHLFETYQFDDAVIFVPTSRSFFVTFEENVFLFLSENIPIDYFISEFGRYYEQAKQFYGRALRNINPPEVHKLFNDILSGEYRKERGVDWIVFEKYGFRTKLDRSSSGQQEFLPMLIVLSVLPALYKSAMFFIEEPETHLFPSSQQKIVNLLSCLSNHEGRRIRFFITTHSPYILAAFNNLIQAGNTLKKLETKKKKAQLFDLVPENQILDIEDVGAYTVEDGGIKSIIDRKNNLIDENIIDTVSTTFSQTFSKLLDMEFEED